MNNDRYQINLEDDIELKKYSGFQEYIEELYDVKNGQHWTQILGFHSDRNEDALKKYFFHLEEFNKIYLHEADFCMNFTNEEIREYLIGPLSGYPDLDIRLLSSDSEVLSENSEEEIRYICFDGDRENFHIRFDGDQTSIFISDEDIELPHKYTFNEEFMFIDDVNKEFYTSSDTGGNIVYEGSLRDKSHQEILELICKFIVLLIGAKQIVIKETIVSKANFFEYPRYKYIIYITNETGVKSKINFNNIFFSINE